MARVKFVHLVNRSSKPIDGMWDGVPSVIQPGYRLERVPMMDPANPDAQLLDKQKRPRFTERIVALDEDGKDLPDGDEPTGTLVEYHEAEAIVRQHPIMGTSDPNSVDARDTDYLLGVREWGDDVTYIEQSDAIEVIDRSLLADDRQDISVRNVAGSRRKPTAADVTNKKIASNKKRERILSRSSVVDVRLSNPVGMEIRGQVNHGEPR